MPVVILENIGRNKKFKAKNNILFQYTQDSQVTPIPIPALKEHETQVIKVAGVLGKIMISFDLITDTEDLSMGTNATPVRTIWEQIAYLTSHFVTETVSERHRVTIDGVGFVKEGAFGNLSIDFRAGEGEKARASVEFYIGAVI